MNNAPRILFLYTELAAYTISCMDELAANAEVHVVNYPVNKEAPFVFQGQHNIHFYGRRSLDKKKLNELVRKIAPEIIICSGWIDRGYIDLCKQWSSKIKTVLALDNKWTGSFRQQFAAIAGRFTVSKYFKYAWV